jgi:hypothetical protein
LITTIFLSLNSCDLSLYQDNHRYAFAFCSLVVVVVWVAEGITSQTSSSRNLQR